MLTSPTTVTHWLTVLTHRYLGELRDDGVADPLGEALLLAAVLADLHRLANAPVPAEIEERLSGDLPL